MAKSKSPLLYDSLPAFADPRYDGYYVPRSKTPERQRFYAWLLDHGWRYDSRQVEWHSPEEAVAQVKGRLCWEPDHSRAWIQPPQAPGRPQPVPVLVLDVIDGEVRPRT